MRVGPNGLPAREVEALAKRYLEGEPGLSLRPLRGGLGLLCRDPLARGQEPAWLFGVATEGGILLRLPPELRDRLVESGVAEANAALPEWVLQLEPREPGPYGAARARTIPREVHGRPDEWVWVPIHEAITFERRRPHILEALAYCRHTMGGA